MNYQWDFSVVWRNFDMLLVGLANTVQITLISLAAGLVLGLVIALARLSKHAFISGPAGAFIDFFRGTPPLVQLFWVYFALPVILDTRIDSFVASVITLTLVSTAFNAEVFRGGIVSIDQGQWDGARALGMSSSQSMRRIILPQAIKRMLPVFLERLIELMKTSTIASTVSFPDLLFQAQDLSLSTYRPLEIFTVIAAMFFLIFFCASRALQALERRLARSGETTVH